MSLNTLLQIGQTIRNAGKDRLSFYSNIEKCPAPRKNVPMLYLNVPLDDEYRIQWDKIHITPENDREDLYYLKFKTSEKDTLNKYMFGDILYGKQCTIKNDGSINVAESGGYYRLPNPENKQQTYKIGSFYRASEDANAIEHESPECDSNLLLKIRNGLAIDMPYLEVMMDNISAIHQFWCNSDNSRLSFFEFINDKTVLEEYNILFNNSALSPKAKKVLGVNENNVEAEKVKKTLSKASTASIFIHFIYPNNCSWYDLEDVLSKVQTKMQEEYVDDLNGNLVFKKTLYRTICSGDPKNDIQFPDFKMSNRYKSASFTKETLLDLFYATSYLKNTITITGDIIMVVLPKGKNLTFEDYLSFIENRNEMNIVNANEHEELSNFWDEEEHKEITSFDLIICRKGSNVTTDIIEISQIDRSHLFNVKNRINNIANEIYKEEQKNINISKEFPRPSISHCLKEILGVPLINKNGYIEFNTDKRYIPHLLKILPQIYMGSYYNDDYLISSFIENVEYSVRADQKYYLFLKYDLLFLLKIQNNKTDKYMEIKESESYKAGLMLGKLAKPLGKKINSFQKNYVGLITRRASTKEDSVVLTNDIIEKLVMHNCYVNQTAIQAIGKLEYFDKELFAFGFFEGYFTYEPSINEENFIKQAEKLVNDYSSDERFKEPLAAIAEAIVIVKATIDNNKNNEK